MAAAWLSVLAYMALIFAVSSSSFNTPLFAKAQKIHVDWLVHVIEYSALGFLLARALKKSKPELAKGALFAAAMAIGVLYAVSDEYHQTFVPTRDASVHDALADAVGLALGAWFWIGRQKNKGIKDA